MSWIDLYFVEARGGSAENVKTKREIFKNLS